MIPAVHRRGARVGGLLRYLYGPGKREEHKDSHLVAAWDGAGELPDLEPAITANGKRDFRHLTKLLEIPVRAGRNPPRKSVWHCSLRTHGSDQTLSDDQWRDIAAEVMARVGLAPDGDAGAVRWVAVRHADDHIHLVATLVRQDRRTAWARNDYALSQAACRDIEKRYGLYRVGAPGQGTRTWPTPGELNKAGRQGRAVAPREELRRRLRATATIATDEADFFDRLRGQGVMVKLRQSARYPDQITGYAVALDGHTAAGGPLIYYSAGKLAADLSLPRLRGRWTGETTLAGSGRRAARLQPAPADVYARAAQTITDAADQLVAYADDPYAMSAIAHAAADLLTATAIAWEGRLGGPLTTAAELFDRAAHETSRPVAPGPGARGYELRAAARLVAVMGELSGDRATAEALKLVRALARLADAIAELRTARQRLHQAAAALAAAAHLRGYVPQGSRTDGAGLREQTRLPSPESRSQGRGR